MILSYGTLEEIVTCAREEHPIYRELWEDRFNDLKALKRRFDDCYVKKCSLGTVLDDWKAAGRKR